MATPGMNGVFSGLSGNTGAGVRIGGTHTSSSGGQGSQKNAYINRMLEGGGINALAPNEREAAKKLLSPEEFSQYALGKSPAGAAAAPATGGSGGTIDANSLMELYQKGLGAGGSGGPSTDDQLRLMREANQLDLGRKRAEQDMQMEGQRQALSQTQEARAKERETEAQLQQRQQSTERSNAMSAFKGL
jgi:hypothetical protein